MALAFLAVGYLPPTPEYDFQKVLARTKQVFGYEVLGYWTFFVEDGADKIIESHVCVHFHIPRVVLAFK